MSVGYWSTVQLTGIVGVIIEFVMYPVSIDMSDGARWPQSRAWVTNVSMFSVESVLLFHYVIMEKRY